MVVMGRIVVRAQHAIEKSARTVARFSQERGFSLRALPIARDANPPAIRKHEAIAAPAPIISSNTIQSERKLRIGFRHASTSA